MSGVGCDGGHAHEPGDERRADHGSYPSAMRTDEIQPGRTGRCDDSRLICSVAMKTRDLRVDSIRPLIPPAILLEELPLGEDASAGITVRAASCARFSRSR